MTRLMQPDVGTSRADFPGGTTEELWDSIQAILALPGDTRLFVGHDYGTDSRDEPEWEATVAEHRAGNRHVKDGTKPRGLDQAARCTRRDPAAARPHPGRAADQPARRPPARTRGRRPQLPEIPVNRSEDTCHGHDGDNSLSRMPAAASGLIPPEDAARAAAAGRPDP